MKRLISIVIPIYNEEQGIAELCKRLSKLTSKLPKYNFEILMVENGSYDNSYKELLSQRKKNKQIKILCLAKNVGTDSGLLAGLTFAKGDAAIVMMADLQDTPDLIPAFLDKWQKGYDIVYGIVTKREKVPFTRRLGTFFFYQLITIITNNLIVNNASDFRLIDKKVYKTILAMPEHNKFFRGLVSWTGFTQIGIPFDRPPRYAGESKAYFTTVMKVALNGIFSFSPLPGYIPFIFSIVFLLLCLISIVFLNVQLVALFFFASSLFFVLWIILEYIRRIFAEVQNRPQFIITEKIGLS